MVENVANQDLSGPVSTALNLPRPPTESSVVWWSRNLFGIQCIVLYHYERTITIISKVFVLEIKNIN